MMKPGDTWQGLKFEPRECPNCGASFVCRGDMYCWCINIDVPEPVQEFIAANFDGCLCEKCIRELIAEHRLVSDKRI